MAEGILLHALTEATGKEVNQQRVHFADYALHDSPGALLLTPEGLQASARSVAGRSAGSYGAQLAAQRRRDRNAPVADSQAGCIAFEDQGFLNQVPMDDNFEVGAES